MEARVSPPPCLTNVYRGAKVARAYDASLGPPIGAKRIASYLESEREEEALEASFRRQTKRPCPTTPDISPAVAETRCAPIPTPDVPRERPYTTPDIGPEVAEKRCALIPTPEVSRDFSRRQTTRCCAPHKQKHALPWEHFAPLKSEDIRGQNNAKKKVQAWLRDWSGTKRPPLPLLSSSCVLQGPPGSGKTTLAKCCILEARMAIMEYGCDSIEELPRFLRSSGAINCDGQRTCLLVEDVTEVLDVKSNSEAGKMSVSFPVVCTASFVIKRQHSRYGAVVSLWPLRPGDMREMLTHTIAPLLRLPQSIFSTLIEQAHGDARQLCIGAAFSSKLSPDIVSRDCALPVYDKVRAYLGGRGGSSKDIARMLVAEDPSHQECCLLQENFMAVPDMSIEAVAIFASFSSLNDMLDTSGVMPLGISARASVTLRRMPAPKTIHISESAWWGINKRREACSSWLQSKRYALEPGVSTCWSARATALRYFAEENAPSLR